MPEYGIKRRETHRGCRGYGAWNFLDHSRKWGGRSTANRQETNRKLTKEQVKAQLDQLFSGQARIKV